MAENTIDNLSIQVTSSADKAASVFDRLASSAGRLRGAASGAAGGMQDMAQGARDAGTATQQAGEQSGRAAERVRTSAARLSRAMYDADSAGRFAQTKSSLDVLNMKYDAAREHLAGLLNAETPNNRAIANATAEVQRLQTELENAGKSAEKGSSGLATFWQSLKRIAYYRMIRSIIKSIGQAFREGAQNLYQWSSANPGLSDFAKNMNRIATSVLYLKNSLGALLEPIVRILTPVIEWVVDKLVWLIDKVNQFFAALSGAETYTAAKKVAQTWGDTSQQVANNTHKAAEEIKRTILGFDEINKLDKPNSGSYGGGSGLPSASAAAQDMFEERPLEGWAKTISDFIRTIASWIDSIFGPIKQLFTDAGNAFDNLNRSLDAAQQEDKTVNINVKINTTAEKLWNDFVDEWNAIKDKTLFFKISPTPPVDLLWNQIKNAWDKEDRTVGFVIKTASSANGHWDVFKNAWDKEDRTVGFLIKTASSAKGHWDNFKKDWDNLESNTVGFLIKTASSANGHWNVFKKEWDAGNRKVGFIITTASSADGHWGVFKKAWVDGDRKVGFIIKTASTADGHWNTFKKAWDAGDRTVYVDVELRKKDWTTVTDFVDDSFGGATGGGGKTSGGGAGRNKSYSVNTGLEFDDSAWQAEWDEFVGKPFDINVDLQQSWLGTPKEYLGFSDLTDKAQQVKVALKKVAAWQTNGIGKYLEITTKTQNVKVGLDKKWGTQSPIDYLKLSGLSTTIKVGLKADDSKIKMRVKQGTATLISATKRTENKEMRTALGGVFSNGRWSRIPQYANGTTNAHGSLFLAGEAGPEIVGHVGGRTEVLNKSQLASAMYSAVQAAMAPAAANFASAAQSIGVANVSFDFETLAEMIRQGVEQAMGRQNELDRQRNEYLRQINEKDYNPEISTSSINKAQQRMNRRAGTTIVPVGT